MGIHMGHVRTNRRLKMEIKDALDIMNSDFKLWENAVSEELGNGRVAKTITLPWGIGEYRVELEGMNDATRRRSAVSAFGEHIREVINDRIDDESITSRAKVKSARVEQDHSSNSDGLGGELRVLESPVQEEADEDTEEAHEELTARSIGLREVLVIRRTEIIDDIDFFNKRRDAAAKELGLLAIDLVAVNAGLEALGDE